MPLEIDRLMGESNYGQFVHALIDWFNINDWLIKK